MSDIIADPSAPTKPASGAQLYTAAEAASLLTPAKRLLANLTARAASPKILDIHLDDCEDDACMGCDPQHLAEKAAGPVGARDALEAYMVHESDEDADEYGKRLDAYRAEVLAEAIDAARGEYLLDGSGTDDDKAYDQGVSDVIAAIDALIEGGESRG